VRVVLGNSEENLVAYQEADDCVAEFGARSGEDDLAVFESDSEQRFGSNFDHRSASLLHCFLLSILC
jgi:hypothetical protein